MVKTNVMKGVYLSEEGKKAIEDKIAELEDIIEKYKECKNWMWFDTVGQLGAYKEILSSATMISVDKMEDGLNIDTIYHPIKTIT